MSHWITFYGYEIDLNKVSFVGTCEVRNFGTKIYTCGFPIVVDQVKVNLEFGLPEKRDTDSIFTHAEMYRGEFMATLNEYLAKNQ